MIKYGCDVCESVENVSKLSFVTGAIKDEQNVNIEYIVEDLDICDIHIKMLAMYLLNRLSRNEGYEEQIAAYKYLQTIAKNNQHKKEGL